MSQVRLGSTFVSLCGMFDRCGGYGIFGHLWMVRYLILGYAGRICIGTYVCVADLLGEGVRVPHLDGK